MVTATEFFKQRLLDEGAEALVAKKVVITASQAECAPPSLWLSLSIADEKGNPLVNLGGGRLYEGGVMTVLDLDQGFHFTLS